jgi:CRP/FNR family transcriptional regulator, cyclic AMP receptor protein
MSGKDKRTSFLGALSVKQRLGLSLECPALTLRRGSYLYLQGDEVTGLFILQSGRLKLSCLQENGKESTMAILEPGDILGLEWLQGEQTREYCTQALESCRVIAVSQERITALLEQRPDLGFVLARIMGEKLRESQQSVERLLRKDVKARLASLLLDLARRSGVPDPNGVRLASRITHQDLAALIGSTRETTTAMLGLFRRNRLIRVEQRLITIAAWDGLEALAS